ncbi:arylesterase [Phenylobacterium sp.]|uniref:arylesterase n=1 Tax=Phenylobacterium sp. TaxID=1871053 RepID=UPI0025CE856D|nr:arylesterase [Phenylobacterium sp.]MBX3485765.1 arylesterase [Phenylobacterium sp.]MCW5761092.1 arylesterase [Phenylobacterium sp.]
MAEPRHTRRALFAWPLIAAAGPAPAQPRTKVVTVLGDSITAGYGLARAAAFPAQLQAQLARLGAPAAVRAAGVSGDTTAGGLARVDFSVRKDTDLAVVALGANDLLQGQDPRRTRANLDGIIKKLKARRIDVLLAGIDAPVEVGGGYARDFNAIFPALARANGVALYPNLLAGVARTPSLNQADGIHPNARGAAIIAARLAPAVARALAARR